MRFDGYRRQVLAVQAPEGLAAAVRGRLADEAPAAAGRGARGGGAVGDGPQPASRAACAPAPRTRPRRRAALATAAVLAAILIGAGAAVLPPAAGPGGAGLLAPATAEALVVRDSRLYVDPNGALSYDRKTRTATLAVCAEFRCANGAGDPCEVRVEGEGLALAAWGRGGDAAPEDALAFEGGRSVKARLVITARIGDEEWWRSPDGDGPAQRALLWRAALPVLGGGRLVLSRPGAPDAVYAFDVTQAPGGGDVLDGLTDGVRAAIPLVPMR